MARPRNPKWRELVLEACSRKNLLLLEQVDYPARNQRLLVACPHHPEGRRLLVRDIVGSKHCCHTGNARSPEGKQQRASTLSAMWDSPEKKIPLLRNNSGHPGAPVTKLYICKIKTKTGSSVLKFGRSERGAKRYGSYLEETIWEFSCPTEKARTVEIYAHLRFSEYSEEVDLDTSGYTECYSMALPVQQVIEFFKRSLQ